MCARCRQTFTNARISSPSRTTTTGMCPARVEKYAPSRSSHSTGPANCQYRENTSSRSSAWMSGSEYQWAGSV